MSLQRGLCSINQSQAAILKTTKLPKYYTPVINPVPTKVLHAKIIHIDILFELEAIFPKSKMAAVS
jgi:hypothetical protein